MSDDFDIPDESAMLAMRPAKRKRAPKAKRPCKYGPRGDDGYCPKKPKTPRKARAPQVRDLESVSAAGRQAGQVLRSSKATAEQKREALGVLGQAVAWESGKKVAEHVATETRKSLKTKQGREALKTVARGAGGLVKATAVGAGIAATLTYGGELLDANRLRESERWADDQLKLTEKRLGRRLTDQEHDALRKQYIEYYYRQPVQNPYLGK